MSNISYRAKLVRLEGDGLGQPRASGHSDERKRFVGGAYEAAEGAEALVLATDWEEFKGALPGALEIRPKS